MHVPHAHAQACVVTGPAQTLETRVRSGNREFLVRADAAHWQADVQGDRAHFDVRSYLRFRSTASLESLPLAFARAQVAWGVARIRNRQQMRLSSAAADGAFVHADVLLGELGSTRVRGRSIPCDELEIVSGALHEAYEAGFRNHPLHVSWRGREEESRWRAGRADAARPMPTFRNPTPIDASSLPLQADLASPAVEVVVGFGAHVEEIRRRTTWSHVVVHAGSSQLVGWVPSSALATQGYGRSGGSFRGRRALAPVLPPPSPPNRPPSHYSGTVRRGAPIYAVPGHEDSVWAQVEGEGEVRFVPEGEWARLVAMPHTELFDADIAWVARADIETLWIRAESGVFDIIEREDGVSYRVRSLTPGSGLERRGVQVGDELRALMDVCCSGVLQGVLWVVRGGTPTRL